MKEQEICGLKRANYETVMDDFIAAEAGDCSSRFHQGIQSIKRVLK
jgi:hypothetical protein